MENKTMHFGKSWFMATMEIQIHEVKISISHFMSSKKDQSQVKKIPITLHKCNVLLIYKLRTTTEHQSLMY